MLIEYKTKSFLRTHRLKRHLSKSPHIIIIIIYRRSVFSPPHNLDNLDKSALKKIKTNTMPFCLNFLLDRFPFDRCLRGLALQTTAVEATNVKAALR